MSSSRTVELCRTVRPVDHEVPGWRSSGVAGATGECPLQRLPRGRGQGSPSLVAFGFLRPEVDRAAVVGLVASGPVAQESLVDVAQGELPDLPPRRAARDACVLRAARGSPRSRAPASPAERLEIPRGGLAEKRAQVLQVDRLRGSRVRSSSSRRFRCSIAASARRPRRREERLRAVEEVAVAAR